MTKKDYVAIASILKRTGADYPVHLMGYPIATARGVEYAQTHIALSLCDLFAQHRSRI